MKRPAEIAAAIVGVVVAAGYLTVDEGKQVSDGIAALLNVGTGLVAALVTAIVASRTRNK